MQKKVLIVEDESMIALDLKLILIKAGYKVCGIADSFHEAKDMVAKYLPDLVLLDIHLKGKLNGIDLAKILVLQNIAFVYLSANLQASILEEAKATQPYGFLVKPFRENELLITLDVAFYRYQNSLESKLRGKNKFLLAIQSILLEPADSREKLLKIVSNIQPYIQFDYLSINKKNSSQEANSYLAFLRTGFDEYQEIGPIEFMNITRIKSHDFKRIIDLPHRNKLEYLSGEDFLNSIQSNELNNVVAKKFQMKSCLNSTFLSFKDEIFTLNFYSRNTHGYHQDHLTLISHIDNILSEAIGENWSNSEKEITASELNKPEIFKNNIRKDIFDKKIVGNSHRMLNVQDMVAIVAPLDTSVLILGESGTGKERIARSIYELSSRNRKPIVIVNCASLPSSLIESELFGHEKGAFTGAIEKRLGKFELADNGTIFLDEIGEMPQELQVKLLRVLQEQEIERIGGKSTIKINVRVIAATNRNLEKEVEEGRFRLDLYYRLYVFPITIPPLRDRIDDIPILTNYFIAQYSAKNGKNITGVSKEVLDQMLSYHWPGNVRELEHLIERSMLLTKGLVINEIFLPKLYFENLNQTNVETRMKSDEENSRAHIIAVLKKCYGKVSGKGGAAEILEMQPTTLHSKIKKLGINKEDI